MNAIRKKLLESKLPDFGELLEVYTEVAKQERVSYENMPPNVKTSQKGVDYLSTLTELEHIVNSMKYAITVTEGIIKN